MFMSAWLTGRSTREFWEIWEDYVFIVFPLIPDLSILFCNGFRVNILMNS